MSADSEAKNTPQPRLFRRWLLVAVWMGLTSYLSTDSFSGSWSEGVLKIWASFMHLPVGIGGIESANLIFRKTGHFLEFFVLGMLLYPAFFQHRHWNERQVVGRVLLTGAIWAALNELQQALTLLREPSVLDAGMDFAGVLVSQLWIWRWKIRPKVQ